MALSTVAESRATMPFMTRTFRSQSRALLVFLVLASISAFTGCAGVSTGPQNSGISGDTSATLAVTPSTLNFGNVAVGHSASLSGSLSATTADVTVSSAEWNGSGYAVSGITFPVTVTAGKNVNYTVTFDPPAAGASPGSISFISNASDSSLTQSLTGNGTGTAGLYSVAFTWDPSASSNVVGYNLYRGTQPGGPYSRLNAALISGTTYSDSTVLTGTTYYYVSTAVNSSSVESAYSNQATAAIP